MVDSARFAALGKDGPADVDNEIPLEDMRDSMPPGHSRDFGGEILPARIAGMPTTLFDLGQMDVWWDTSAGALWAFNTPFDRPNYNLALLRDTMQWQQEARRLFGTEPSEL